MDKIWVGCTTATADWLLKLLHSSLSSRRVSLQFRPHRVLPKGRTTGHYVVSQKYCAFWIPTTGGFALDGGCVVCFLWSNIPQRLPSSPWLSFPFDYYPSFNCESSNGPSGGCLPKHIMTSSIQMTSPSPILPGSSTLSRRRKKLTEPSNSQYEWNCASYPNFYSVFLAVSLSFLYQSFSRH